MGIARVREALEANSWAADEDKDLDQLGQPKKKKNPSFGDTFAAEEAEMNVELMNMKTAVNDGNEADEANEALQVEELERMMGRLQAVKGKSRKSHI